MLAAAVTVAAVSGLALAAEPAQPASLCVGSGSGCYPTIQAAVNAAHAGDTITIRAGAFAGGVTITKSIHLQGAGAASTIIRGGDHVLTIGAYGAGERADRLDQRCDRHRRGWPGRTRNRSRSLGKAGVVGSRRRHRDPAGSASGGRRDGDDYRQRDHRQPRQPEFGWVPSGITCPGSFPQGQCPFARPSGGGIDSWGALTLIHTAVTRNSADAAPGQPGTASDADGGGIFSRQGGLTLENAVVTGNHATAVSPAGRFAEGGGIWAGVPDSGRGTGSGREVPGHQGTAEISGNTASLSTDPRPVFGGQVQNLVANTGGVLVAGRTSDDHDVENTGVISGNLAIAYGPEGRGGRDQRRHERDQRLAGHVR